PGRPPRGARCGRIRLHGVDAVLPLAPDPGRGSDPRRPRRAHPAAHRPGGVARPPADPLLGASERRGPGAIRRYRTGRQPRLRTSSVTAGTPRPARDAEGTDAPNPPLDGEQSLATGAPAAPAVHPPSGPPV